MILIQPVVVALYNQSGVKRNEEGTVVCCYECINVCVMHSYIPTSYLSTTMKYLPTKTTGTIVDPLSVLYFGEIHDMLSFV